MPHFGYNTLSSDTSSAILICTSLSLFAFSLKLESDSLGFPAGSLIVSLFTI